MLPKAEILATLRVLLSQGVKQPLWLAGGLAADFHVGRWTREHRDIDLVSFEEHRPELIRELMAIGFTQTDDRGWITRWTRSGRDIGEVSLAFQQRVDATTGALVIRDDDTDGELVPGVYPGVPGNMDPDRYRTLEGISFRVMSAEDEWAYAQGFQSMRPGAQHSDTVQHNLALLESVIDGEDLERVRTSAGRRLPLDPDKT